MALFELCPKKKKHKKKKKKKDAEDFKTCYSQVKKSFTLHSVDGKPSVGNFQ